MTGVALRRAAVGAVLLAAISGHDAQADDKADKTHHAKTPAAAPAAQTSAYNWSGLYVGVNAGKAWGSFDPLTSTTVSPTYLFRPADVAAVNAAGVQDIKPSGFLAGLQAGYNQQFGPVVLGLETGLDYLHLSGETNSGAVRYPGGGSGFGNTDGGRFFPYNQFAISVYDHANWLFTLRPRIGVAANNWLFYATGGLAVATLNGQYQFTDYNARDQALGAVQNSTVDVTRTGYAVGGGIEAGVTDRISLKAEYLFVDFGRVYGIEQSSDFSSFKPPAIQTFSQSMDLKTSLLRVGLNYRFGVVDPTPAYASSWLPLKAPRLAAPANAASDWEFDVGTRLWFSTGKTGAPDPLLDVPPLSTTTINSRLTYVDQHAYSGETFARIDHRSGFFVKGFIGAGGLTSGTFYDEDFPGDRAYSNTLQTSTGSLAYTTIDAGYSFLKTPGARVGAFVGYNFFAQHIDTFGCTQLAGDDICVPASAPNTTGLEEDDQFDSLRVGLTTDVMLTDRLKLSAEAAYLPWVNFRGLDNHDWRELQLPEGGTKGDGVMLETILSYAVTNNWSVGVGGRYWAWYMREGTVGFDFLGLSGQPIQLARYNAERYGVFLQTDYRFGDMTPPAASGAVLPVKAPALTAVPTNWTGFYLGGHVGGGVSNESWADPFGSTKMGGLVDVAGFGDTIYSTGPLLGAQAGINWQTGHWVVGVEGDWSATDLRGQNTCFSGIGGVDCENVIKSLGSVAGRAGLAWDRALIYAKGGAAWAAVTASVLANTAGKSNGFGASQNTVLGWLVGGGLEYAVTGNWSAMLEYTHIDLDSFTALFPTIALAKAQATGIKQSIDTLSLGVNYRFDWTMLVNSRN